MEDNRVLSQSETHHPFTEEEIRRALREVCEETGFIPDEETDRRFFYQPDKPWRVKVSGLYQGESAVLRLENLKLITDEEALCAAFREQRGMVRPPHTYQHAVFDEQRGYAWAIQEARTGHPLVERPTDPSQAAHSFVRFYDALRMTVRTPFTESPALTVKAFSERQLGEWQALADRNFPGQRQKLPTFVQKLPELLIEVAHDEPLRFMHAHLTSSDIDVLPDGCYVVHANHFWSWRQPGYDIAFTVWSQWMALPVDWRNELGFSTLTSLWMDAMFPLQKRYIVPPVERGEPEHELVPDLHQWANPLQVQRMLLNRCYGSLVLDIPAKRGQEPPEAVDALEYAMVKEAERLLHACC